MPSRRPLIASLAALAALAWPSAARAAPFALAIRYQAPASCPAQQVLERELAARDLAFRPPAPGEPATRLDVALRQEDGVIHGALEIGLLSGDVTRRELQGASCDDLVRSLALIASLALAPIAADPASASPPAASSAPPPPPATTQPPAPGPPPPAPRPAGSWATATGPLIGVGLGVVHGLVPGTAPGLMAWVERPSVFTSLGLGVSYWPSGSNDLASFSSVLLDVTPCFLLDSPLFDRARPISLCGGFQGGALMARGKAVDNPTSATRAWFSAKLGARAWFEVYPKRRVEGYVWGFLPLTRDTFVFEQPRIEVYRPPPVGFGASVGAAFDFF